MSRHICECDLTLMHGDEPCGKPAFEKWQGEDSEGRFILWVCDYCLNYHSDEKKQ